MFSLPNDPYVKAGDLPASLLLGPSAVLGLNALCRVDDKAGLVLHVLGVCVTVALACSVGVTLAAPSADAVDDETLGVGLDEDVSDDGSAVYAEAVKEYAATIGYVHDVAEEERERLVELLGDRLVTSPTCNKIRSELPRGLVSLEAARGDGHSLYLNGRFAGPRGAAKSWVPETAFYVGALSAIPLSAIGAVALAEAAASGAVVALALALPCALILGFHAGGGKQAEIYAALAHDQKYEEWNSLSTVPFAQPGVIRSILKPALRRSNSSSNLRRSNSRDSLRSRALNAPIRRRRVHA